MTADEYCRQTGGLCLAHGERVSQISALCVQSPSVSVSLGQCAGLYDSVVWREPLLGGGEEYYGTGGHLIAAYRYTDYPAYCNGTSFTQAFASRPVCPQAETTTDLCARDP